MAYPIGAEILSESLANVPQFEKLVIWFSSYNYSASNRQQLRKENEPYEICRISMIHPLKAFSASKYFIEEGFYNENWEIHIHPVPRELKNVAKQILIQDVLPKAKEWMEIPRTEIWKTGRKHFKAFFKENEPRILIQQD